MKLKTATATAMAPAPVRSMTMSAAAAPAFTSRAGASHKQTAPVKPMGVSGTLHTRASKLKAGVKAGVKPEINPGLSGGAQQGSQQTARLARRDRVVLEHLPLVKAIAVRVHENLPVHVDMDDLVHAGILGLFDAASKYNPDKQVAFSSYAKHRIKGAILDSLRQLDWASRDMRRRHKQVEAATRDLASTLQRNPTEAEVAAKLGMDPERWRGMMLDLRNVGLISASTRSNEYDDLPAPDFPCKPETHPDSICAREQLRGVLGEAMKVLPERYQKVVSLYYTAEMTMKEIGGILGINESRVSQIHKSALEKMQVALTANGISSSQAF
ncbi:MAG TPA: FliA/WhiG family RNA polymerase sigma factor [Bryobacteraceae bacterium]|nr:FliA/WhiG family RNA polymerase sigma factor [Bryobacteraceae bacterium]